MPLAVSAVRMFVDDLAPALAFYRDVLGLPLLAQAAAFAVFDAGSLQLVIEHGTQDERGQPLCGRFSGLSFRVDDAQGEYDRLQRHGVRLAGLPERQDWGGILVTFEDPAGNQMQLVQYPD